MSPATDTSAPSVVAPPPGHRRFPLIDSLRAVAAVGVLMGHAGYTAGAVQNAWYGSLIANMDSGVTLFFLISGFLLYRPFVAADMLGLPRPRIVDFARRRVLRIVPAYWLALTVLAIYPGLAGVFTGDWPWFYFLGQAYGPGTAIEGISFAWSLNVEATFYLLLPLYAFAVSRLLKGASPGRRLKVELTALTGLGILSVALRAVDLSGSGALQLTLATTFLWFSLGMGLAVADVAFEAGARRPGVVRLIMRAPSITWLAAGCLFLLQSVIVSVSPGELLAYTDRQWLAYHVLSAGVALLLMLPAVFGQREKSAVQRLLGLGVLRWLGLVSYGVFLWHGGVLIALQRWGLVEATTGSRFLVTTSATLALSVTLAAMSYYLVERPILRFKYDTRRPLTRPGAREARSPTG